MMKKIALDKFIILFGLFIIGSIIGFAHENIFTMLKGKIILRQGLIYGPFIPVYGFGLLLFYGAYSHIDLDKYSKFVEIIVIFIVGFIMGGFTEYLCSYLQELFMGTKSWDYSDVKFNIDGRTSLFHASAWGLMSVLFYEMILPIIKKTEKFIDNKKVKVFIIFLSIFMFFDCTISTLACLRQTERRNNIEAKNKLDIFLDKYYPDDLLNKIYSNAEVIKK